jgi:hypothetical protein
MSEKSMTIGNLQEFYSSDGARLHQLGTPDTRHYCVSPG